MKCTALIVTFNRLEKLKKTVFETVNLNFTSIVIVNNGSTDGTSDWLQTITDSRVTVLNIINNNGGAGGFKTGSQYICSSVDSDWIFFYDDDAYPQNDILDKFSTINKDSCCVYMALVNDLQGRTCMMNTPFTKVPTSFSDTLKYIKNPQRYVPNNKESLVKTVSFVGMIIKRELLNEHLHHIYDELFIYFDDVYFGHHLTLSGEKILYNPQLVFTHNLSSQGKIIFPEWKVYYLCRNLILSRKIFKEISFFSDLSIFLRLCKYIFIIPAQRSKLLYIKYLCHGIIHGLKGISGKLHY